MERRRELRVDMRAQAEVMVLGEESRRMTGQILDISGRGMRLELDQYLAPDTPLRIDCCDEMFLGEVVHCRQTGAQTGEIWQVGVEVQECLLHAPELLALSKSLAEMDRGPQQPCGSVGPAKADATMEIAPHGNGNPRKR